MKTRTDHNKHIQCHEEHYDHTNDATDDLISEINIRNHGKFLNENKHFNYQLQDLACINCYWFNSNSGNLIKQRSSRFMETPIKLKI